MPAFKSFLHRLGSPDAINWLSVVAVMIFQTCASLITSGVAFDQALALFLTVRLSSLIAFISVLAIGKQILLRLAKKRPQPLITVITFLVGITASTAVFDWLLVVTGLTEQSFLARRIVLSLVGATVILTMVAIIVTTARDYAASNRGLQGAIAGVADLRQTTTERLQQRRDGLVATIRELINDHLSEASLPGSRADDVMKNLIDDVIRPLSHTLGKHPAPDMRSSEITTPSIPWRLVVRGALTESPYPLLAFPGAMGAIVATFLVMSFGLRGVVVTLAVFAGAVIISALLGALWRVLPRKTPLGVRFIAFTVSVVPFLAFSVVFIATTTGFDLSATPVRFAAWAVMVTGTWWVAALTTSVFRQLRATNADLEAVLETQRTELAALNATDRRLRQGISRVLHGPVQEAVASSLRKLNTTPELANEQAFFDTVRGRIQAALATLDTATATPIDLVGELGDVTDVWEGSVAIHHTVSPATVDVLSQHPDTAHVVLELIREACHNAIKHGDATAIEVSVATGQPPDHVVLTVTNNGSPLPHNAVRGLGGQLFEEVCVSWRISNGQHGVTLSAHLPTLPR